MFSSSTLVYCIIPYFRLRLNSNIFMAVMHFTGDEMKALVSSVVLQDLHSDCDVKIEVFYVLKKLNALINVHTDDDSIETCLQLQGVQRKK